MAVKKLFFYKVKTYWSWMVALIILQAMSMLIFSGYSSGTGNYSGAFYITSQIMQYNLVGSLIYGIAWIGFLSIILSSRRGFRYDFTFITTRRITSITNILLIICSAMLCGITMVLSHLAFRVIRYMVGSPQSILLLGFKPPLTEVFTAMAGAFGYLLLIGGLCYLLGSLYCFNAILGAVVSAGCMAGIGTQALLPVLYFFIRENDLPLFMAKCLVVSSVLFAVSVVLAENREVL